MQLSLVSLAVSSADTLLVSDILLESSLLLSSRQKSGWFIIINDKCIISDQRKISNDKLKKEFSELNLCNEGIQKLSSR